MRCFLEAAKVEQWLAGVTFPTNRITDVGRTSVGSAIFCAKWSSEIDSLIAVARHIRPAVERHHRRARGPANPVA
jgi:hypothetical protein